MKTFIITCDDLTEDISNRIKSMGHWACPVTSTMLLKTDEDAMQIYLQLRPLLKRDDRIFVAEVTGDCEGYLDNVVLDWIKTHLSR